MQSLRFILFGVLFLFKMVGLSQTLPVFVPKNGLVVWYSFNNNANDLSGNKRDGKVSGGAKPANDRFGNAHSAYSFNGLTGGVICENFPVLKNQYTYSTWIKGADDSYTDVIVFCQSGLKEKNEFPSFGFSCNGRKIIARHRTSDYKLTTLDVGNISRDWTMASITWNGNVFKVYCNGKLVDSVAVSTSAQFGKNLQVGLGLAGQERKWMFNGFVDDVGVWNRALTPVEINQLYTSSLPASKLKDKSPIEEKKVTSNSNVKTEYPIIKVESTNSTSKSNSNKYVVLYDKDMTLKKGDHVVFTKKEKVKVPGEKKEQEVNVNLGKGKILEVFDKTAKVELDSLGVSQLSEYKSGDENYFFLKSEKEKLDILYPSIMVLPNKVNLNEFELTTNQKLLISSIKNELENNHYTTIGFESTFRRMNENRLINSNSETDIKSLILESSNAEFYVEFEILESKECRKSVELKITNVSTGEDVASDIGVLNTCGSPEEYKSFAKQILNNGALVKMNNQFNSYLLNGKKLSINFILDSSSEITLSSVISGKRLDTVIEETVRSLSFNGKYKSTGAVSNRISFSEVYYAVYNEAGSFQNTPNTIASEIINQLEAQTSLHFEKSVVGSSINISIR
jgi:hypothetical protein